MTLKGVSDAMEVGEEVDVLEEVPAGLPVGVPEPLGVSEGVAAVAGETWREGKGGWWGARGEGTGGQGKHSGWACREAGWRERGSLPEAARRAPEKLAHLKNVMPLQYPAPDTHTHHTAKQECSETQKLYTDSCRFRPPACHCCRVFDYRLQMKTKNVVGQVESANIVCVR